MSFNVMAATRAGLRRNPPWAPLAESSRFAFTSSCNTFEVNEGGESISLAISAREMVLPRLLSFAFKTMARIAYSQAFENIFYGFKGKFFFNSDKIVRIQ